MKRSLRSLAAWCAFVCASATVEDALAQTADWPQWGGPSRNFVIDDPGLAQTWSPEGPRSLWTRKLGDGYSAIVTAGDTGYVVWRDGDKDATTAFEIRTGRVRWEHRTDAPFNETCSERLGPVSRATPLVAGDLLFTVSAGGRLSAIIRQSGATAWQKDLFSDRLKAIRACGYSSSPIAFGDTLILMVGEPGRSIVALRQKDGMPVYERHDFPNGYSSPLLIDVSGRKQLVALMGREVLGLDPSNGDLLWRHPHRTESDVNASTPLWGDGNLLFMSSGYDGGSRVLRLSQAEGTTSAAELWAHRRVRVHFGSAVRMGDRVYLSNGDFGPAPLTAIDVRTGEVVWRQRVASRASLLGVGARLLILDEDGELILGTPTDTELKIDARFRVLESRAWTAPTLAGTVLLVRDRVSLKAYDLGKDGVP